MRSPAAAVQPAPAGHRARARRPVRTDRSQALALVGAGVSADEFAADPGRFDIPDSVIGFLRGELGDPPGGWPEPLRTKALAGRPPAKPAAQLTADDETVLAKPGAVRRARLNRLLFPAPT